MAAAIWALAVAGHGQDPAPTPAKKPAPAIAVGKPAPAFRLNDDGGRLTKVGGKTANWTVLAFYPKASTPG
ncbi:MAG: hypothetical protein NXI31_08520 [bacterium]|nr:hypothetical protein [bacterium]